MNATTSIEETGMTEIKKCVYRLRNATVARFAAENAHNAKGGGFENISHLQVLREDEEDAWEAANFYLTNDECNDISREAINCFIESVLCKTVREAQ